MTATTHRRRSTLRRAGNWAVNGAMLLVMLGCLAWVVPSQLGLTRYVITGDSMTGTIDKGSVVFEKPVAVDDLRVGDIITYLPPPDSGMTTLVTHRIIKIEPAEGGGLLFTTKGDANPKRDPWHFSLTNQQQPVVQYSVPKVGWAFIALADRKTRILLVGIPAGLIALGALVQLLGALRKPRARDEDVDQDQELDPAAPAEDAPDRATTRVHQLV